MKKLRAVKGPLALLSVGAVMMVSACAPDDVIDDVNEEDSEVTFDPTLSVNQQNNTTLNYNENLGGDNLGADLPEGDWEWESLTLEVGGEQFDLLDENLPERDEGKTHIEPGVSPGEYEATITGVDPNGEEHSNSTEYVVEADDDTVDISLMEYNGEQEKAEELGEDQVNGTGYYDEDIPVHIELDTMNPGVEGEVTLLDDDDNEVGSAPVDDDGVARITIPANTIDPDETRGEFSVDYSGDDLNEATTGVVHLDIYGGDDDFGEGYR